MALLGEPPTTVLAGEGEVPGVQAGVGGEVTALGKLLPAGVALEFLFTGVCLEVQGEVGPLPEGSGALRALVRPLPRVQPEVVRQGAA